jgi:2-polyprenyl-6-methoxyphenol hydroxylase-like FAD-dependent oxidoreductase
MSAPRPDPTANETARSALARASKDASAPVLIAGAGIGGLATALALARKDIPSHILESRPDFGAEGAGIQIGPNGTRILQSLGVSDALKLHVGVPEAIAVRDGGGGHELARLPLGRWIAERHGAPYWVVHRSDLHAALVAAARAEPLIALSTDTAVAGVAATNDAVAVASASGAAWTGRALVGADGLWSAVRGSLFATSAPRFAGKSAARSVVPLVNVAPELQRPEVGIWLFPDAHVVHYPVSGGSALAIVVIVADTLGGGEDWSAPVTPQWVAQRLPACADALRGLVATPQTWRRWALHTLPPLATWTRGPVTLLGDAAHAIVPFLAQGGVLALEDAVVLAEVLQQSGTTAADAFQAYERRRRPRALRVANASLQNGRIYHLTGLPATARDLALRTLPPALVMSRYDWLYGWRAQ